MGTDLENNRKYAYVLGSAPCSWPRAPKTLIISWVSAFRFNEVTLGGLLDGGCSPADQAMVGSLELSAHPHSLEKGEGLEIVNN